MAEPEKIEFEYQVSMNQLDDFRYACQHENYIRSQAYSEPEYTQIYNQTETIAIIIAGAIPTLVTYVFLNLHGGVTEPYAFFLIPMFAISCLTYAGAYRLFSKYVSRKHTELVTYRMWYEIVEENDTYHVTITPENICVRSANNECHRFAWDKLMAQIIETDNYMIIMYGYLYIIPKNVLPMPTKDISKWIEIWAHDSLDKNKDKESKEEA